MTDSDDLSNSSGEPGSVMPAGIITVGRTMSKADFEEFKAEFLKAMSQPGWSHRTVLAAPMEIHIPCSKWQAFKLSHRSAWWMRWLVRRWPVRDEVKPLTD